jgi:tetratricopeptide (TPR) repeat protein
MRKMGRLAGTLGRVVFGAPLFGSAGYKDALEQTRVLVTQGDFHAALELLLEASREYTADVEAARIRYEMGTASQRLGDEPRAISSYWSAVKLADAAGRTADCIQLASLWNLGTIYVISGHPDRLKPVLDQYWRLRSVMDRSDPTRMAYSVRFAVLCQSAHNYRDSEALFLEGVNLLRGSPDRAALADALSNLGSLYTFWSRHKEAIACNREALELGRYLPIERFTGIEINLAAAYLGVRDVNRAASTLDDAAASMRAGGASLENARGFYWNEAKLCRKMHRRHDAAVYMSMWKSVNGEAAERTLPESIDMSEMSGAKSRR